ncbi:BnaC07g16960D [Brassica napus]|uniref:(rape) hypothetical protein n=1 Tax=Brassica napus TaxID=3708 RepID=A0A078GZ69_BRANA|nr:unnamed protein product [Brassica napus]CDY30796.1 BnaC07g16960D [Brassica napus]
MGRNIWWLFLNNEIRHIKSFTRYEVKDEEAALIFPKDPPWFKLWMVPVMMLFIFFIVVVILICRRCQNCRQCSKKATCTSERDEWRCRRSSHAHLTSFSLSCTGENRDITTIRASHP